MNRFFGHQIDDFIFKMMLAGGVYTVATIIATLITIVGGVR